MRRVTAVLSAAAVVVMTAGAMAQAKPSFSGEWKIVADQGLGEPGKDLTITQSATVLTVEYRPGTQPGPAKLTYNLDGSASRNQAAGGAASEQVSRAAWTTGKLVVTTTTAAGDETRTFALEDGNLVIQTTAPARKGSAAATNKVTYKRYQQGHGG